MQSKDTCPQGAPPLIVFQSGIFTATQTVFSIGSAKPPVASNRRDQSYLQAYLRSLKAYVIIIIIIVIIIIINYLLQLCKKATLFTHT